MNELLNLMARLDTDGLLEIAKKSPAYDIAIGIINTRDLRKIDHDMAKTLANPTMWFLSKYPEWEYFCKEWNDV